MPDTRVGILLEVQDRASAALKTVGGNLSSLQSKMMPATEASQKAAVGLAAFGVAAAGLAAKGVMVAGQLETMRQGFVTLLGSAEKADETMKRIKQEAARTPFELAGLTSATQALALVTKDGNKSIDVLLNVGKALAAAGKGQVELDRIIANLQQIALTGKITEMDIRQFGMNGVNVLELLADQYGVTTAEAGEMVKNSKDAFGDLSAAFEKAGAEGGRFGRAFIDQAGTFNQLMSNLKDSVSIALSDIVTQTGLFDAVKKAVGALVDLIADNQEKIIQFITNFVNNKEALAITAGIIAGALAPSIYALAGSFASLMLTLTPFMAIGAGLAYLAYQIYTNWDTLEPVIMRVWNAIDKALSPAFTSLWNTITTQLYPALQNLWNVVATQLLPALGQLWAAVEPIAKVYGTVLVAAIFLAINILIKLIEWVTKVIAIWASMTASIISTAIPAIEAVTKVIGGLVNKFQSAVDWIKNTISALKELKNSGGSMGIVGGAFNKIFNVNDAIIAPNGNIISTHPDDYLIATKNPAALGGGSGLVINIMGGNFLSEDAGLQLGDQIYNVLSRNLKN